MPSGLLCAVCYGKAAGLITIIKSGVEILISCPSCFEADGFGEKNFGKVGRPLNQFCRQPTSDKQVIVFGCIRMFSSDVVQPGTVNSLRSFVSTSRLEVVTISFSVSFLRLGNTCQAVMLLTLSK